MTLKLDSPIIKTSAYFLLGLGIAAVVACGKHYFIAYNPTLSEPIGYYLTIPEWNIKPENVYMITIPEHYMSIIKKLGYNANSGMLLKKVIAKSGDTVAITESGVVINNKLIPDSKAAQSARGVNLDPQPIGYNHVLSNGEYWVLGNTAHSYDSRYFGVITEHQVHKRAIFMFE